MASQMKIFNFNALFVIVAALICIIVAVQGSPVPEDVAAVAVEAVATDDDSARDGRFYGLGNSQATAIATASANSDSTGFGGYPYGGGYGGYGGYPYGK